MNLSSLNCSVASNHHAWHLVPTVVDPRDRATDIGFVVDAGFAASVGVEYRVVVS